MNRGGMEPTPVNIEAALAQFDEVYSPRIIGQVNDYDIRIAHTRGEHVWHTHDHTDEFFLVVGGQFSISLRDPDGASGPSICGPETYSWCPGAPSTSPRPRAATS